MGKLICHKEGCYHEAKFVKMCAYDTAQRFPTCAHHWDKDYEPPQLDLPAAYNDADIDDALNRMNDFRIDEGRFGKDIDHFYTRLSEWRAVEARMNQRMYEPYKYTPHCVSSTGAIGRWRSRCKNKADWLMMHEYDPMLYFPICDKHKDEKYTDERELREELDIESALSDARAPRRDSQYIFVPVQRAAEVADEMNRQNKERLNQYNKEAMDI